MNIQIFGAKKCFDTAKAERFFKERGVKFQRIELPRFGISRRELESVIKACGGIEKLINMENDDAVLIMHLADNEQKIEKILDNPQILLTPIVRNGKLATVGYCPEIWKQWE